MFGKLNPQEIEDLISHQLVGRLGCHADHVTYIVPVSYAYDGVYIYGRTFEGKKVDMMRKNPRVCFQIDNFTDMANWQSVIAWGVFEEISAPAERKKALQVLVDRVLPLVSSQTQHLTPQWPFPASDVNSIDGIVYRIRLFEKTGRFEKAEATSFYAS
jgi:nitroimidazol reductase NimA-like FMN-containing flavoprotein (pyridoxamine 5'-phosphate oxidase superfamily)